jgi:hypothetical protein
MAEDTMPTVDDDLRDAIEEDERSVLIRELRERGESDN